MYYRVAYVPGGQAIGALETAYAKLGKRVKALLRRRQHVRGAGLDPNEEEPSPRAA
jgi:lipopolysaccharide export system permease protein